jgi:hypothetical protein
VGRLLLVTWYRWSSVVDEMPRDYRFCILPIVKMPEVSCPECGNPVEFEEYADGNSHREFYVCRKCDLCQEV